MDYKTKYHKYKAKYLELLKRMQTGGKIFKQKQILYIVATISQPKMRQITNELTARLLGPKVKPYRAAHVTVLNLQINAENPDSSLFQNPDFYNRIPDIYADTLANARDPAILFAEPAPRDYSLPGYRPRYFIKNYYIDNADKILAFREKIFGLVQEFLGKPKITETRDTTGAKYYVYSYHGRELFAESSYYDVWKPHLNFMNDFDIEKSNPDLYHQLVKSYTSREKVEILLHEIGDIPLDIYQEINMARQMRKLTYAIDHVMQKKFKIG